MSEGGGEREEAIPQGATVLCPPSPRAPSRTVTATSTRAPCPGGDVRVMRVCGTVTTAASSGRPAQVTCTSPTSAPKCSPSSVTLAPPPVGTPAQAKGASPHGAITTTPVFVREPYAASRVASAQSNHATNGRHDAATSHALRAVQPRGVRHTAGAERHASNPHPHPRPPPPPAGSSGNVPKPDTVTADTMGAAYPDGQRRGTRQSSRGQVAATHKAPSPSPCRDTARTPHAMIRRRRRV